MVGGGPLRIPNYFINKNLHHPASGKFQNSVVLGLGSGTGIVGISAALTGANVILTDIPEAIAPLTANIERNRDGIQAAGGSAVGRAWDWTGVEAVPLQPLRSDGLRGPSPSSFILGSDLVYATHQSLQLSRALKSAATAWPGSTILVAHKHRSEEVDLSLLGCLSNEGFIVEKEADVVELKHQSKTSSGTGHDESVEASESALLRLLLKHPNVCIYRMRLKTM